MASKRLRRAQTFVRKYKTVFFFIAVTLALTSWALHNECITWQHQRVAYYLARHFHYPVSGDVSKYIEQLKHNSTPAVLPLNNLRFTFSKRCDDKCSRHDPDLVFLVKSSVENLARREVIRRTWGDENRWPNVNIKRVFIVGLTFDDKVQESVNKEYEEHGDIVQANFVDIYEGLTNKTMAALQWANTVCPTSLFYHLVDDDTYVSTKNLLMFLQNPHQYPRDKQAEILHSQTLFTSTLPRNLVLYAGQVLEFAEPIRDPTSKWHLPFLDYPHDYFPPFVRGPSAILSRLALVRLFYVTMYTKTIKLEDVFLGLAAFKAKLQLQNVEQVVSFRQLPLWSYRNVISYHGFSQPEKQEKVWIRQKELGNA